MTRRPVRRKIGKIYSDGTSVRLLCRHCAHAVLSRMPSENSLEKIKEMRYGQYR
ncbi:hypothetical protein BACCAP_04866 [Pseudoflavonifractor capillosus ATCC 29799]|uniref:Uncharacterized protein n=1 Tax=Pseudoflavonifractor capillosus ATCC 29799 TaxID=411467 RepID=A6P2Y2_9FIRM|nr:hypothetical protein BACCAP_04866 [Pseudoflavonifractor capillosus ATCC 29799]